MTSQLLLTLQSHADRRCNVTRGDRSRSKAVALDQSSNSQSPLRSPTHRDDQRSTNRRRKSMRIWNSSNQVLRRRPTSADATWANKQQRRPRGLPRQHLQPAPTDASRARGKEEGEITASGTPVQPAAPMQDDSDYEIAPTEVAPSPATRVFPDVAPLPRRDERATVQDLTQDSPTTMVSTDEQHHAA